MHTLVLLCINQHTKVLSFTYFTCTIGAKFKNGHVTLTTPIRGCFVILRLALDVFYLHTKFGDFCFSR